MKLHSLVSALAVATAALAAPALAQAPAPAGGPAWWHVTKGASEVWIIGTPDFLPTNTAFDDAALRAHMQGARGALVPPVPNQFAKRYQTTLQPPVWKTLAARLPDGFYPRLYADLSLAQDRRSAQSAQTYSMAGLMNRLDRAPVYVAGVALAQGALPITPIGNPVANKVRSLALRENNLPVDLIKDGAALYPRYVGHAKISDADQATCVQILAGKFERGELSLAATQAGVNAWANGDLAHTLITYNPGYSCDYGALSADFWSGVVNYDVEAVQKALTFPGKTVAVLELKPLLMDQGVLEKLTASGARVEGPGF